MSPRERPPTVRRPGHGAVIVVVATCRRRRLDDRLRVKECGGQRGAGHRRRSRPTSTSPQHRNTPSRTPPDSPPTSAMLSFVVSAPRTPCDAELGRRPTRWPQRRTGSDLDRRVARLRQLGGEVTVSFGGAANSELSIGCTDPAELTAAYQSVVDRYSVDLDRPRHRGCDRVGSGRLDAPRPCDRRRASRAGRGREAAGRSG